MTTFLGIPLVGKLFLPTVAVGAFMMLVAVILTRWAQKFQPSLTSVPPMDPTQALGTSESIEETFTDQPASQKTKKKKKSCCGTKGGCCKTKKDAETTEEKKSGCGCACGTKKENGSSSSCSSEAGSDSEDVPMVLDVEELGRMAESLRPSLPSSPNKSTTAPRVPGTRVKLRTSADVSSKSATIESQPPIVSLAF